MWGFTLADYYCSGDKTQAAKATRNNPETIPERRNGHAVAAIPTVVVVNNYESDRDGVEKVPQSNWRPE